VTGTGDVEETSKVCKKGSGSITFSTNVTNSNFSMGNTVVNDLKVATALAAGKVQRRVNK
jgi:hypothetical protein